MRARVIMAGGPIVAVLLAAAPAFAQQHLFCEDGGGAGLFWDREPAGPGRLSAVAPERFTVNIVSPQRRLITKQDNGVRETACRAPEWPKGNAGLVTCTDASGAETWLFNGERYTRSYLFGTPLATGYTDPNITVAYGTCRPY